MFKDDRVNRIIRKCKKYDYLSNIDEYFNDEGIELTWNMLIDELTDYSERFKDWEYDYTNKNDVNCKAFLQRFLSNNVKDNTFEVTVTSYDSLDSGKTADTTAVKLKDSTVDDAIKQIASRYNINVHSIEYDTVYKDTNTLAYINNNKVLLSNFNTNEVLRGFFYDNNDTLHLFDYSPKEAI